MKNNAYSIFFAILSFVCLIAVVVIKAYGNSSPLTETAIFLLWLITVAVFIASFLCKTIIVHIRNIKKSRSSDPIFSQIDEYRKGFKDNYGTQIQIINHLYSDGCEVDDIIRSGDIERLIMRKNYLKQIIVTAKDIANIFLTLIISISVTYIMDTLENYNVNANVMIWVITASILIFLIYSGSKDMNDTLRDYEIMLLDEKLMKAKNREIISHDTKKLMLKKQVILNLLHEEEVKIKRYKDKKILRETIDRVERDEIKDFNEITYLLTKKGKARLKKLVEEYNI